MHECVFAWHLYCFTESVSQHLKERSTAQCSFSAAQLTEMSVCESFCTIDSWTLPNKTFKESHFTVPFRNVACVVNLSGLVFCQLSSSWLVWGQQEPDKEPTEHISHADSLYCGVCLCVCTRCPCFFFRPLCERLRISVFQKTIMSASLKRLCVSVCIVFNSRQFGWPCCLPNSLCN